MLISHSHQFIYLKTRKSAGTSVEMAFQPWAAVKPDAEVVEKTHAKVSVNGVIGSRLIFKPEEKPVDKIWYNHMPAAAVENRLSSRLWGRYLKIAVVRNPFDRIVSHFHWNKIFRHTYRERVNSMSTDLEMPPEPEDFSETKKEFRDFVLADGWHTDEDVVTLRGKWCVDVLLRYEQLRQDVDNLAIRLEIEPALVVLPTTKMTGHLRKKEPLNSYFCAQTTKHVRDRLSWMFERGEYPDTPRAWDDKLSGLAKP